MKNKFDFAADSITVNEKTFPARYEVTAAAINVFATVTEDGNEKTVCICINAGDPLYGPAALAAAKEAPQAEPEAEQTEQEAEQTAEEAEQTAEEAEQAAPEAEQAAPEAEQAAPEAEQTAEEAEQTEEAQQAEPEAQQAEETQQAAPEAEKIEQEAEQTEQEAPQAARDPKAARGVVPEKTFIGQSITGAGWAIIFDGAHNRTRVIISKSQHDKLRGIVENAGFYYSAALDSWNRKLTFRAYRAAQALAQELTAALAA